MTKSLGQVAYEAWHLEHMSPGLSAPYNWNNEYPDGKRAWQAAAEAVAQHVNEERESLEALVASKEQAVIEAARALAKVKSWGQVEEPLVALRDAVEALQELEGE